MKEKCDKAWKRFDQLKNEAEQYLFPAIAAWDLQLTPFYNDLQKNWDEHHAEIFLRGMNKMFAFFGIDFEC